MADFLCGVCSRLMCDDCKSMAGEYVALHNNHMMAAKIANDKAEKLTRENEQLKRENEMYKELVQTSLPDLISAWVTSIQIDLCLERVKNVERHKRDIAEFDRLMKANKPDEAIAIAKRWVP